MLEQVLAIGKPHRRAWIEIDAQAIAHNVRVIRGQLSTRTALWGVVKANAYGHSVTAMLPGLIAGGVSGLCVATLDEGIELRATGIPLPIMILGALTTPEEWHEAVAHDLEMTLTHSQQCAALEAWNGPLRYHLKIDTGMSRLGIPWTDIAPLWSKLARLSGVRCQSLYSHLATAEEPDHPALALQQQRFRGVLTALAQTGIPLPPVHLSNSAAALGIPSAHYDRVRVGIALYGIPPAPTLDVGGQLRPALQVKARIVHIQTVPAGTGVSYGHRFIAPHALTLATVAIGYADGIPRILSGRIQGSLAGVPISQVGTITMDQCMWDISPVPDARVGDVVTLFAAGESASTWAEKAGTIPYEIVCGFSQRLPRVEP